MAWQTKTIDETANLAGDEPNPVARLRTLAQSLATRDKLETAMRGWAQSDKGARTACDNVDAARITLFQDALSETGINNPEMSRIIYATAIGMTAMPKAAPKDSHAAIGSLIDLVLALR